jgi:hypothetical protein
MVIFSCAALMVVEKSCHFGSTFFVVCANQTVAIPAKNSVMMIFFIK